MPEQEGKPFKKIDLSLNENIYGVPQSIFHNIKISDINLSNYCNKNILIDYLIDSYGFVTGSIITGNGTEDLLLRLFHLILHEKDVILLADVGWEHYGTLANKVNARCEYFSLCVDDFKFYFDENSIIQTAKKYLPKIIIINSPNNPTGNVMSYKQLESVLVNCPDSIILFDECYKGFDGNLSYEEQQKLANKYDNVVFLNSFSKFFALAALRIGFAVTNPYIVKLYERISPRWDISPLSLMLAREIVINKKIFFESASKIRKTRDWFISQIRKNTKIKIYDSESNFVFVEHISAYEIRDRLFQAGYKVKCGQNYLRITIGKQHDMEKIFNVISEFPCDI